MTYSAHTGRHTHKRPPQCSRNRMSSHQRKQPAAAADTDEQEQEQHPQCRICLDGPDPDLGRLIRPCLCSGTVSVSAGNAPFFPPLLTQCTQTLTLANRITYPHRIAICSLSLSKKTPAFRIARTRRLSSALEKYFFKYLLLLCLSTMPLPLPLCPYQDSRPCYQPRFVPSSTLYDYFGKRLL